MDALIGAPLETIPADYLPYLIKRDVPSIRKYRTADFMLFPAIPGSMSWLFALILMIVLVSGHFGGDLDYDMVPGGIALIAVLISFPLVIMAYRKPRFMYRVKAYNEGIIKTPDAFLLRFEKDRFSLIPYGAITSIRLAEGRSSSAGDAACKYIDLEIEYESAGSVSTYAVPDFILGFHSSYYRDSADKRRTASFFEGIFVENEYSSQELYEKKRGIRPKKRRGEKWMPS